MAEIIPEIVSVVIDAIITICGLVFTGVFIPWVVQTGIPWLKEKRLHTIVETFVKAAEKMADAGTLGIQKLDYVEQMLERNNIEVTPEVRAMIEAAVKDLDIAFLGAIGALGKVFDDEPPCGAGETEAEKEIE